MTKTKLDITGKVCPYCLLAVQKAAAGLSKGDELIITCDHPPAATTTIPLFAKENALALSSRKIESGLWELTLIKVT